MRAAVDCREMDQGDVREVIVVGNPCRGKPGSHGSKVVLLSHVKGVDWQMNNRLVHQMPDALNYKEGPHPGYTFQRLML